MRITVYRVEKDGDGPYKEYEDWITRDHAKLPTPMKEDLITKKEINDYKCGFIDMKQFKKWFTKKELNNLDRLGYKLAIFHILNKNVLLGKRQLIFYKKAKTFNKKYKRLTQV